MPDQDQLNDFLEALGSAGSPKAKSFEFWIWDGTCSIRGAKDTPKDNNSIQPLIFTKRSAPSIH
ncbi:hypothetical protein [Synechococcus sp. BA-132 BA5]|uniref:hypothetical protein n=1 Tax=Synechococcus sp. BA-132 BA5 TaxID=3110252 RepID=UPI002B1ED73C|nr:hypothetical protein [Synechococcus sp. BA-132 BA5]MEA5414192.1 hypothetical protein [Synechococcus sp. BA-132 BA5]